MPSRNMAIRDAVYRKLSEAKGEEESFSEVIERLLEKKPSLLPLSGALSSSKELDEIEEITKEVRKSAMARP